MTADHAGQTGGELLVACAAVPNQTGTWAVNPPKSARCYRAYGHNGEHHNPAGMIWGPPSRPVPPAGQAAREAAVEAVARNELAESIRDELAQWPIGSGYYSTTVSTSDAAEMVDVILPLIDAHVAALSAAPGQEPLHEWPCPNCGATTRARMADHPGQEQGR